MQKGEPLKVQLSTIDDSHTQTLSCRRRCMVFSTLLRSDSLHIQESSLRYPHLRSDPIKNRHCGPLPALETVWEPLQYQDDKA